MVLTDPILDVSRGILPSSGKVRLADDSGVSHAKLSFADYPGVDTIFVNTSALLIC
jgi:hypothetical protein